MKSLTLSQNSLHFKLAQLGGYSRWHDDDICAYTKCVLFGVVLTLALTVIASLIWKVIVETVLGFIFSVIYHSDLFSEYGNFGAILVVAGLIVGIVYFICIQTNNFIYSCKERLAGLPPSTKPDGFIKAAYKSHKERYCLRIDFTV